LIISELKYENPFNNFILLIIVVLIISLKTDSGILCLEEILITQNFRILNEKY